MQVIIHDIEPEKFLYLFPKFPENKTKIICDDKNIQNCVGCFGCWIKSPGECAIKDNYENMGKTLSQADEVMIISKCYYGGYSPFIKNILDRSISYLLPVFECINNKTHHRQRYKKCFDLSVYFYSDRLTKEEKEIALELVQANCVNFHVPHHTVNFFDSIFQIGKEVKMY